MKGSQNFFLTPTFFLLTGCPSGSYEKLDGCHAQTLSAWVSTPINEELSSGHSASKAAKGELRVSDTVLSP